jgi:hypothetical protein
MFTEVNGEHFVTNEAILDFGKLLRYVDTWRSIY